MCLIGSTKLRDMSKKMPKHTSKNWCKLQKMFLLCAGLGAQNLECRLVDENPTFRLVDENPTFRLVDEKSNIPPGTVLPMGRLKLFMFITFN